MLLKECYDAFGGSYEDIKQRISKDETIKKFLIMFLNEPSYGNLCQALENEDYEKAFRAAHSLKGISQNLSFQRLEGSSGMLTELLRDSGEVPVDKEQCKELFERTVSDYEEVVEAVKQFVNEQ